MNDRYALQHRAIETGQWELGETFTRRGDALIERDDCLANEPDHLPEGRTRAIDLETGTIIEWERES
jgi:hypothetical protein